MYKEPMDFSVGRTRIVCLNHDGSVWGMVLNTVGVGGRLG